MTSQWGQGPPVAETAEGQEDAAVTKLACPGSAVGRPSPGEGQAMSGGERPSLPLAFTDRHAPMPPTALQGP